MSADFTPTYRTNRTIGTIEAGSPIRVTRYDAAVFFSDLLGYLGGQGDHIEYRYCGKDVEFWDPRREVTTRRRVIPGNYVITDGEHFEVLDMDSGWNPIPSRNVSGTEEVNVSFQETHYCIYGAETGHALRLTLGQLRNLAAKINDALPEVSPIENARFIRAFLSAGPPGEYRTLAKVDGLWYDHNGTQYTEEQVGRYYDEIDVIV